MNKCLCILLTILLLAGALPASAEPDYPKIYKFYMELGKFAIEQGDYEEAYLDFQHAQAVAPNEKEPAFFINVLKRIREGRIEPEHETRVVPVGPKKDRMRIVEETLDAYVRAYGRQKEQLTTPSRPARVTRKRQMAPPAGKRTPSEAPLPPAGRQIFEPPDVLRPARQEIVYMDDTLWKTQPGTLIRVEMKSSVQLEGKNIERYLIVTPGAFDVARLDEERLKITGRRRGTSFLHVWDDRGRWTFKIETLIPVQRSSVQLRAIDEANETRPFKVTYAADWGSYYRGPTFKKAERDSLNFLQRVVIEGETPYGDFDSHVVFNKFEESTEVTGYGVGLTDGKIGDFKDFSIRGFDLRKTFSPLSMPGQYVRGVLFEAPAFDHKLAYAYIRGRDRQIYSYLSSNVLEERNSYIEGARATLFPKEDTQFSFNFARGFGDAREPFLKDRVMSFEAQHKVKDVVLSGEVGYDEDVMAVTSRMLYDRGNHRVSLNFRDIDKEYTTIASYPAHRGEVGGTIFWNWRLGDVNVGTYLDLYRERLQPNPESTGVVNVDFNTRVDIPLFETDRLSTSVYYNDTSGELSPRNSVRVNTRYTKRFKVLSGRDLKAFIGATQQRNRFARSSSSENDRYSAIAGFSVPLAVRLNYYANYEYSWLYDHQTGDLTGPNVFNTGLNYTKRLTGGWSVYTGFNYRNEENTGGTNSFLAGEDSITGSFGTSFRPNEDFEIFIDGRARDIWGQEADRASYNEYDISIGMRTSWETPFRWEPKGVIKGVVFKDINGDQRRDGGDKGIPDVRVRVGGQTVTTDASGAYRSSFRGKRAEVTVDMNTVPDGYVFSTPVAETVMISPHKIHGVDFGLTTQSGIYGIIFYDRNGDGRPDVGDEFVSGVHLTLDEQKTAVSDFEGTYFFENMPPGTHEIAIEINSLPMQYLPAVKLKNKVNVSEGATYVFHIPLTKIKKE